MAKYLEDIRVLGGTVSIGSLNPSDIHKLEVVSGTTSAPLETSISAAIYTQNNKSLDLVSNSSALTIGIVNDISSNNDNQMVGQYGVASWNQTSTSGITLTKDVSLIGVYGQAQVIGSSTNPTASAVAGFRSSVSTVTADASIDNAYGVKASIASNNAGIIGEYRGLFINDMSSISGVPPSSLRYGVYQSDSGNNYFEGTVGIGTSLPDYKLEVVGTMSASELTIGGDTGFKANISGSDGTVAYVATRYQTNAAGPGFLGRKSRGTQATPSQTLANDSLSLFVGTGYHSSGDWHSALGGIKIVAEENFTNVAAGTNVQIHTTAIGASSSTERVRITADGDVGINTSSLIAGAKVHIINSDTDTTTYGSYVSVNGSNSTKVGLYTILSNATSEARGLDVVFSGNTGKVVGVNVSNTSTLGVSNSDVGYQYYSNVSNSSNNYGAYYRISATSSTNTTMFLQIQGGVGSQTSIYSQISGSTYTTNWGWRHVDSSTAGTKYGQNVQVYGNGLSTTNYGSYLSVYGASSINYGYYSSVSGDYGANKYGVYSNVTGSNGTSTVNYAAWNQSNNGFRNVGMFAVAGSGSLGLSGDAAIVGRVSSVLTSSQSNTYVAYLSNADDRSGSQAYGIYIQNSSNSTTKYGNYTSVVGSGTSTNNYGDYISVSGGNSNNYGEYILISGTFGSTVNYGSYINNQSNVNLSYGLRSVVSNGVQNVGVSADVSGGTNFSDGLIANVTGTATTKTGVNVNVTGASTNNYGLQIRSSGATNSYALVAYSGDVIFNEDGADYDFRIEGLTESNLFFVDADNDNMGMGTNTPDPKALLEMVSTTKGFLPPRMTTTQRESIPTPPAGLLIFNTTTSKHEGYDGATWSAFY